MYLCVLLFFLSTATASTIEAPNNVFACSLIDELGAIEVFKCRDGSGCLSKKRLCDGVQDCIDGSDEEYCPNGVYRHQRLGNQSEVYTSFRHRRSPANDPDTVTAEDAASSYGRHNHSGHPTYPKELWKPCTIKSATPPEDGVLICSFLHGEDTFPVRRLKWPNGLVAPVTAGCFLPAYPDHGTYVVTNVENAYPGQYLDFFQLTVTCRSGYGVVGDDRQVYCLDGLWSQTMPNCVRFCKLNPDPSVRYTCHDSGTAFKECKSFVAPGTSVNPICNTPYYYSIENLPYMKCISGYWDYVATCKAECGRVTPENELLVLGGERAKRGELPWHAGIYSKTTEPYMQICGGTLISNNVVISAAHCFWNDVNKQLPSSNYAVAIGKLYRPWNNERDVSVQKSDISDIKLPPLFKGGATNYQEDIAIVIMTTPVTYQTFVRPVCLSFNSNFDKWQLQQGKLGKVAGWGLTSPAGIASPVLQVVDLPYIREDICINNVPSTFREYLTADKFCAGYNNGTALCQGDSGGGLVFGDIELGITRYYLRGVVSSAPKSEDEKVCNDNAYTAFTKIIKHEEFINTALAASVKKTCPSYVFQCVDGTCVDQGADCNGIKECADGSDEAEELCNVGGHLNNRESKPVCLLPPYPEHGSYEVKGQPNARPGQSFETIELTVICNQGYGAVDEQHISSLGVETASCHKGNWRRGLAKCVAACKLNQDPHISYQCQDLVTKRWKTCEGIVAPGTTVTPACSRYYYLADGPKNMNCVAGSWDYVATCKTAFCQLKQDPSISYICQTPGTNERKPCEETLAPGTIAYPTCNSPSYFPGDDFQNLTCTASSWDHVAKCNEDCGRISSIDVTQDGNVTKRDFMPWHVSIFVKHLNKYYSYLSNGNLVKHNIVLCTAFEYWDDKNKKLKSRSYAVQAGELYRWWNSDKNTHAQRSEVTRVILTSSYVGGTNNYLEDVAVLILETPFTYTPYVSTVCLDFNSARNRQLLSEGHSGKMLTWAILQQGVIRLPLDLPILDSYTCANMAPSRGHLINGDKFCTGIGSNNDTTLKSLAILGAGYFTSQADAGVERYYLRGIQTNYCFAYKNDYCNGNNYIVFNKISDMQDLLAQYIST